MNIVSLMETQDDELRLYVKRGIDIVLSGLLLVVLSPILLIMAILVKLSSKGPVLYEWNVVGINKKPFKSWKIRTMIFNTVDYDEGGSPWTNCR